MSFADQLPWLALAVFVVGTPHGALDGRLGRTLLRPRIGDWWLPAFLLAYLACAGAALTLWLASPALALGTFLVLAAIHFGSHDSPSRHPLAIAARGFLPPVIAAAAHPGELGTIFGWLAGSGGAGLMPWLAGPGLMLWLGAATVTLALEQGWRARAELLVLTALFAFAPPLMAFAAYFALVHTPRAMAGSRRAGERWASLLASALPFTLGALLLAAAGYALARTTLAPEPAFVRTVFWWLGALTVPHMLLGALSHPRPPSSRHVAPSASQPELSR